MVLLLVRWVLIALGCAGLYALWRWTTRDGGRAALIVTGGLLLRALLAVALFWISWLELPAARSLQLGNGFWFFAVDGPGYIMDAARFASGTLPDVYPARFHVNVLGVFVWLFGAYASTAILLNCALYLGTCAVIIALARRKTSGALLFTLAAVAFGPSVVLWSLQPLKDTLFMFLVTALTGASAWWKDARTPMSRLASGVVLIALGGAIASLRWYFGLFLWAAWALFALAVAIRSRHRLRTFAAAVVVLVLLGGAVGYGARDDLPLLKRRRSPVALLDSIAQRFGKTQGATTIRPGPPPPAPAPQPAAPAPASRFMADATATFIPRFIAQPLGLMHVGGGRGFWLAADFDTLVFDAVVLFALIYAIRSRARGPLFMLVMLLFFLTAVPMIYVVNNFGTLFRLRGMLYLLAALVPVTIAREYHATRFL